MKIDRRF